MYAIVDANVASELFWDPKTTAGGLFFNWLNRRNSGTLAIGGSLRGELCTNMDFLRWLRTALLQGRAKDFGDESVNAETESLQSRAICRSDDEHVLALAIISGARLLFTNDRYLQDDFRDRAILGDSEGVVYTTINRKDIRDSHRDILWRRR